MGLPLSETFSEVESFIILNKKNECSKRVEQNKFNQLFTYNPNNHKSL